MFVKNCFDYVFGVPGINMRIKLKISKSNITENVMVKTVNTTSVSDVRLGVMNVSSLGNKMDCVIDHITDNKLDIVGITETWLSNNDKKQHASDEHMFRQWLYLTSSPQKYW